MTATQAPTPGPLSEDDVNRECKACGAFKPDPNAACTFCGLAPTAPVEASGSEREDEDAVEVEDMEWPESPLANDLYQHIQSQFCLHPDEAADETGEVLSILDKHGVDPTKLPLNLRPQPSGETRERARSVERIKGWLERNPQGGAEPIHPDDLRALLSALSTTPARAAKDAKQANRDSVTKGDGVWIKAKASDVCTSCCGVHVPTIHEKDVVTYVHWSNVALDPPPAADEDRVRADRYYEALVQADLKIRSLPGTDQSDVEFIRAALKSEGK